MEDGPPDEVLVGEGEEAGERLAQPVQRARGDVQRRDALGSQQPLLGRDRVEVGPEARQPDRDRADRLRPIDRQDCPASMRELGDPLDREAGTSRPGDVADRHEPRPRDDRRVERGESRLVVSPRPDVDEDQLDPEPVAQGEQRAERARVLEPRRDRPVAGPPVDRPAGDVHRLGGRVDEGDRLGSRAADRRHARPGLVHPLEEFSEVVRAGPADPELTVGQLGHEPMGLGRQRPNRSGVEIDPRGRRRQRFADRDQALVFREEWGDHGSVSYEP